MGFSKTAKDDAQEEQLESFTLDGDPDIVIVLDGDQIAFRTAAAAEERGVKVTNPVSGQSVVFKNRTELKKLLHNITDSPENFFEIEDTQIAEPVQNAISTIKHTIKNIGDTCNAGSFEIYVGDSNNFRLELPLPSPYKDRGDTIRPLLLKELKDYLIDYKGATWIDGMETDDMISIREYEGYTEDKKIIAVSSDKDQMMTQGWIFDPNKMEKPFKVKGFGDLFLDSSTKNDSVKGFGRKFLYYQFGLIGDKVDTYCPRDVLKQWNGKKPRFGEKTAYNLLKPCKTDQECFDVVSAQYKKWYGEDEFTYTTFDGKEVTTDWYGLMSTYFLTAYMRRWEDDDTTLNSWLEEFEVEYE